jgi:biopolymer transport protein ExbD
MNIDFNCPECGRELRADSRHVGRKVRCPDCATLIAVPAVKRTIEESIIDLEAVEPEQPPAESKPREVKAEKVRRKDKKPPRVTEPAAPAVPPPPPPEANAASTEPPPQALPVATEEDAAAAENPLFPAPQRHAEDLIDMTAMVDIVFFLLIFFLVTSLQALEAVMDMPTPQASEGAVSTGKSMADLENDPNSVIVRIEDDDSIWVEDEQVFNDAELAFRLRSAKAGGERGSLLVIGDADASHGAAVRVFDAGAAAGMNGISFIVQEKGEGAN